VLELIYATVRSQISSMIERRRIRKEHYFRLLNLKKKNREWEWEWNVERKKTQLFSLW
jgi:hypothetical protein